MIAIFYGEEQYAIKKEIEKFASKLVDLEDSFSFVELEYPKILSLGILEEAQTFSMFSNCKVIVVKQANFLSNEKLKDDYLEELIEVVLKADDTVNFVFVTDGIDKRKKIVKDLIHKATIKEFKLMDDYAKQRFITKEINVRNLRINRDLQVVLENRLPNNMQIIMNELDKLELYGENLNKENMERLVIRSAEDRIFELIDAIIKKNRRNTVSIYQDLKALRTEEIQLIALLDSQFKVLYQVKVCLSSGMFEAAIVTKLKAHPFQIKKSISAVQNITIKFLREHLLLLATLDQEIKAGKVDKQIGFEQYLLRSIQ